MKLLPAIATEAATRARRLNLALSTYITILLSNHAQAPVRGLVAEPDSPKLARVHVPCTIRRSVWLAVRPHITASKLSANAFVETLIARDLRSGSASLTVLPRKN